MAHPRGTRVVVLGIALTTSACSSPPTDYIAAARTAVAAAETNARDYAPESVQAARVAREALDTEVKAQERRWFKSYDRVRELAAAAKAAGEKATADAAAAKKVADASAAKARADAAARATRARAEAPVVPLHAGRGIKPPAKIKDVRPVYPAIAQAARVQGTVVLDATVGPDGRVTSTKVIKTVPMLDRAAVDAVRQWRYAPTRVKGRAVPIVLTIAVNFTRP
jgi:TonB family protein